MLMLSCCSCLQRPANMERLDRFEQVRKEIVDGMTYKLDKVSVASIKTVVRLQVSILCLNLCRRSYCTQYPILSEPLGRDCVRTYVSDPNTPSRDGTLRITILELIDQDQLLLASGVVH